MKPQGRISDQYVRLRKELEICVPLHENMKRQRAVENGALEQPYLYFGANPCREAGTEASHRLHPRDTARIDSNRPVYGQSAFPDRETDS